MGRTLCNLEIYVFFRVDSISVEFSYDWSKPREKLPLDLTWGYCFILLKGVQDLTVCKIKYYIFICFHFQFVSNEACQSTTFFLLFDFRLCQTKLFNQDIILNEHVKLSFLSIGCNSMINVLWIYFEIFVALFRLICCRKDTKLNDSFEGTSTTHFNLVICEKNMGF